MKSVSLEKGIKETKNIIKKIPEKIPVILEKASNDIKKGIKTTIYYIDKGVKLPSFISQLQKKLNLNSEDALFLLVKWKNALVGNQTFQEIYDKYKDKDGFLYITYACELVWGN